MSLILERAARDVPHGERSLAPLQGTPMGFVLQRRVHREDQIKELVVVRRAVHADRDGDSRVGSEDVHNANAERLARVESQRPETGPYLHHTEPKATWMLG